MKNLTPKSLVKAQRSIEAMKSRYSNAMKKSEEVVEHIVHGVESFGSAFAFGVLQGKYASKGGIGVMGVPVELAFGVGAYVASSMGVGGNLASHLIPLGQGALSAYATTLGRSVGSRMSGSSKKTSVSGEDRLTAKELAALSNPGQ